MRVSENAALGPKGTEERLRVQKDQCATQTAQVSLSWSRPTLQLLLTGGASFRPFENSSNHKVLGIEKNERLSLANIYKDHIGGRIKCPSALTVLFATAETQVRGAGPPSQSTLPEPWEDGGWVREMRAARRNPTGVTVKSMPVLEKIESTRPETISKRRKIHTFHHFPKQSKKWCREEQRAQLTGGPWQHQNAWSLPVLPG